MARAPREGMRQTRAREIAVARGLGAMAGMRREHP